MSSERKYVLITRELLREVRDVNAKLTEVLDTPNPFKWNNISDADLIEEVRIRGFEIKNAVIHEKWVNLTEEEYAYGLQLSSNTSWMQAAKWVEATLKRKNLG